MGAVSRVAQPARTRTATAAPRVIARIYRPPRVPAATAWRACRFQAESRPPVYFGRRAAPAEHRGTEQAFISFSMAAAYGSGEDVNKICEVMMRFRHLVCAIAGLAAAVPATAHPPRPRDQDVVFRGTRDGRFMPLRAIEGRIVPRMH